MSWRRSHPGRLLCLLLVACTASGAGSPAAIGRSSYLETIDRVHRLVAGPRLHWLRSYDPYPNLDANLETAVFFAFRFRSTGREVYARWAVDFVESSRRLLAAEDVAHGMGGIPVSPLALRVDWIWRWLEGSRALTPTVRGWLREILLATVPRFPSQTVELGSFNRPLGTALVGEILLRYAPEANDAALWRRYVERVWEQFRSEKDTCENSGNYNALGFAYLIQWVEVRGEASAFFADPAIQRLFERYLLQVLPLGSLPHYGDSMGWNVEWGHWIWIFEAAARHTRDGRFRWAAQLLFDYGTRHIEDLLSWSYTGTWAIESLMRAHAVADDSVVPVAPARDLVVTERASIERAAGVGPSCGPFRTDPSRRMPSKLRMRSDASPRSTALLVELTPEAGHGPPVAPALLALVDRGAVLLMDQGYSERDLQFHNTVWLEDYEGLPLRPGLQRYQVLETEERGPLLYARVRVESYAGYPVDLERSLLLARPGALLVRDELLFREPLRVRVGPVYNLGVLRPERGGRGESWVNGSVGDWIPVRGIGAGTPVLARWRNPARDLLLFFVPTRGAELVVHDRGERDPTSPLPLRVQQRWRGQVEAGDRIAFATVLLPHAPEDPAAALAASVAVAQHTSRSSAVRVPLGVDRWVWLTIGAVDRAEISTDARAAVAVVERGVVTSTGTSGGTHLSVAGRAVSPAPPP